MFGVCQRFPLIPGLGICANDWAIVSARGKLFLFINLASPTFLFLTADAHLRVLSKRSDGKIDLLTPREGLLKLPMMAPIVLSMNLLLSTEDGIHINSVVLVFVTRLPLLWGLITLCGCMGPFLVGKILTLKFFERV